MIWTLFRTSLARQRMLLLLFGVLAVLFPALIGLTYRALGGEAGLADLQRLLPEGLKALMRAQGGFLPGQGATGWLAAAGYRHPVLLVLLSAATVAVAWAAVAREVERGTILLLLARPLDRWKLLLSWQCVLIAVLAPLLALTLSGAAIGFSAAGALGQVQWARVAWVLPNTMALLLAIGGFAFVLSARSSESGTVIGPAAAVTLLSFLLDYVSQIWEPLRGLGFVSVFHYYNPVGVVDSGAPPWRDLAVLLGVAAVGLAAAIVVFQRRDIAR
jgi:ABC-type transport system involved in multi-copper enzyme maturation permease subunit